MTFREFMIQKLESMPQLRKPEQTKTLTEYCVLGKGGYHIEVPVPKPESKRMAADLGYALYKLAECYQRTFSYDREIIIGKLILEKEEMEKTQ